jgi:hypothetical protein
MAKVRKRRRLLRVVIAAALLVVAVPTVAAAHEHLGPIDVLDRDRRAGAATDKGACSVDPRHAALKKPGAQLCHNDQFTANDIPTGQERAYAQHLVPPDGTARAEGRGPRTARIDQAPAPSHRTEIESWWWMLGIVVAAGGAAGLIIGLRRGRLPQLSS